VTGGAAGSAGEVVPYFEPGSRLKPRVLVLDDGPDIIEGGMRASRWQDSELGFDCHFLLDEEGQERCFPFESLTRELYSDTDCTRPVLAQGSLHPCSDPGVRYVAGPVGFCAFRGFQVGPELPSSTPLFTSFDGTCTPVSGVNGPIHELEPTPSDAFVGMRQTKRTRAPDLDAHVREGDDGSWEIIGYFDAARDASCFEPPFDWSPRSPCIPSFVSSTGFADDACDLPLADASLRTCNVEQPTAVLADHADKDACPLALSFELYEIDDVREASSYGLDGSETCVASTSEPAEAYVSGRSIDVSTLPVLDALVGGRGEVRALFSGFGGIPYVPIWRGSGPLIHESGDSCVPYEWTDGTVRCVSTSSAASARSAFRYEEASCGGAPVVAWVARPTCPVDPPLPPVVVLLDQSSDCAREVVFAEAMTVSGKTTPSTLFAKDATTGACGPAEAVSPTVTYLRLGEELGPTVFPELERTLRQ
jgi:hypothetical protein